MPAEVLLNGINRCLFATANDEIRLVMNGIYVDINPDYIIFAGTDGRKLVRNTNHTIKSGITAGFILPKKVCAILKTVLNKDEEQIEVLFDADKATIKSEDMTMHFRLIEGRYPNYNAVIPQSNPFKATVDRMALASALKRVSVFCNQSSGLVKVELSNNSMKLTGQDNEYATSAEEFLVCDYTATSISIGFSCQFLLEIANIMESDTITLEVADPSRPGIIRPAEEDTEDEVLMLLMPMRVED
jgi:DNA polymerase-3 subunit beta